MGLFNNNKNSDDKHKGGGLKQVYELAKPALNLSADQQKRIEEIFSQFKEERQTLKGGGDSNRDEIRTARQQSKQKIMDVLNPDQKKIWEENINKWKEQAS